MAHYAPMMPDPSREELIAWLRLSAEPGLGRAAARQLLTVFGLPQAIFAASQTALSRHLSPELAQRLASAPDAGVQACIDTALALLARPDHHLITLADPGYPAALFDSPDPPTVLYVWGDPGFLERPAVAIVGARNATEGGKDNARAFSCHLAQRGWVIISGLARGIDAAAHEGALQAGLSGGGTVAVLACGLDTLYPPQHRALAEAIAGHGAVISEYPPGTPAQPFRFPDRNRLVAALARGVLIVEAATQSGSLVTARLAGEYGREIFAIPGSIHAPLSRGCHQLIRQGAKLVEQGSDIEEELQRSGPMPAPAAHSRPPLPPTRRGVPAHATPSPLSAPRPVGRLLKDPTVGRVLSALGYDPADADQLCQRTGLAFSRIATVLSELELNDIVTKQADGRYVRRQQGIIYD